MQKKTIHPLAEWLEREGLKQVEFAQQVGCSESHLSLILSRDRGISWTLAQRLSQATGGRVRAEQFMAEAYS
jgi:plasmid maintenance system antidote protein VapI